MFVTRYSIGKSNAAVLIVWILVFGLCVLLLACCKTKPESGFSENQRFPEEKHVRKSQKIKIFEDYSFYRQRSESEEMFVGTIQKNKVILGPNTRDMPFQLVTPDLSIQVYTTNREAVILSRYIDQRVKVTGKRIDQTKEGFGWELWISSFELFLGN